MFPPMDAYLNYLLLQRSQSSQPMIPQLSNPQNPVDQLRALYATHSPPAVPPPPSAQTKRTIHSTLKPPLFVSNEKKFAGNIRYQEVTDPSVPENCTNRFYMMCGECESNKLFRQTSSLMKHRMKNCKPKLMSETSSYESVSNKPNLGEALDPITEIKPKESQATTACGSMESEDSELNQIMTEARAFLEGLSESRLIEEFEKIRPKSSFLTREAIIESLLRYITHDVEVIVESPTNPSSEMNLGDLTELYRAKASDILCQFPRIPQHLLAIALVIDSTSTNNADHRRAPYFESVYVQTCSPFRDGRSKQKRIRRAENSGIQPKKRVYENSPKARRSTRLSKHYIYILIGLLFINSQKKTFFSVVTLCFHHYLIESTLC